ncbi:MAG: hypothetical protein WKG01_21245 [Kofleriaceae bacterium]
MTRSSTETLRLLDATDLDWIDDVLDIVEAARAEPWRALQERVEHAGIPAAPVRIAESSARSVA